MVGEQGNTAVHVMCAWGVDMGECALMSRP